MESFSYFHIHNYIYYVKGDNVRIDEIGTKSHKVEGSFLVDMEAKTMKSLNHERKLYMEQGNASAPVIKGTCKVKKGQNVKNYSKTIHLL